MPHSNILQAKACRSRKFVISIKYLSAQLNIYGPSALVLSLQVRNGISSWPTRTIFWLHQTSKLCIYLSVKKDDRSRWWKSLWKEAVRRWGRRLTGRPLTQDTRTLHCRLLREANFFIHGVRLKRSTADVEGATDSLGRIHYAPPLQQSPARYIQ